MKRIRRKDNAVIKGENNDQNLLVMIRCNPYDNIKNITTAIFYLLISTPHLSLDSAEISSVSDFRRFPEAAIDEEKLVVEKVEGENPKNDWDGVVSRSTSSSSSVLTLLLS